MDNRKGNEIRINKLMQHRFENERKSCNFGSLAVVWRSWATFLAPRWPKVRVGSHLGLKLETSWGSSCRQDGPSWAKMAPRWRYVGQLGAQDGQLGTILGGILGHISDLERDLSKNRRSVKMTNTTTLFCGFSRVGSSSGGSFGRYFGRCLLQDGVF